MTRATTTGYEWGLALWNRLPRRFFDLRQRLMPDPNRGIAAHGDLWFVLFERAHVRLVSYSRDLQCEGCIHDGVWTPTLQPPAAPMVTYMQLTAHEDDPGIDLKFRPRPGFLLSHPHSSRAQSVPLLHYNRALWIRGQSDRLPLHGEVGLRGGISGRIGYHHVWRAFGIATDSVDDPGDIVCRAPDETLRNCTPVPPFGTRDLSSRATRHMAEFLGLRPWSGPRPRREAMLHRGEFVLCRLGATEELTPCLVISPAELHAHRDDVVLLECFPYHQGDESTSLLVPLRENVPSDQRHSVSLTSVRGIAYGSRYVRRYSPPILCQDVDPDAFMRIEAGLEDLYA